MGGTSVASAPVSFCHDEMRDRDPVTYLASAVE